MALIFILNHALKKVPRIQEIGFDGSAERYQLPPRQRFISKYQHAELHNELKKNRHEYRSTKLLRIPFDRQDIYSKYYREGQFRYKGQVLELVDRQKEKRPSNSEVIVEFKNEFSII